MSTYVLNPDLVREAVEDLHDRRIHPHFATYLGLTRYAEQHGTTRRMQYPYADYLENHYRVEASSGRNMTIDGSEKEFLTPFTLHYIPESKWKGDNWQQQVSPGTAGRSQADQGLHMVGDMDGDEMTYTLHDDHVDKALEYLLFGDPVPAIPVAAYLYRNEGFAAESGEPELIDVEELFREEYGFQDDADFETLFISDYELGVEDQFIDYND